MYKNKTKIVIFILSMFLFIIAIKGALPGIANFHKNKADALSEAGVEISKNIENIKMLNNYLLTNKIETDELLAIIENNVAISSFEFQLRMNLHEALGTFQTHNELLDKIITEKMILSEAQKLDLLPTEIEIQEMIGWQREQINLSEDSQEILKTIIEAGNLSEDEYWEVYERYNTIRILTEKKLYEHIINIAVDKGDLPEIQNDKISMEDLKKREEYFIEYIGNLKSNAKIQIEYNEFGIKLTG